MALWGTIPREAREQLLKNVFCAKCRGSVEIIKFTGEERDGNLVLTGPPAPLHGHTGRRKGTNGSEQGKKPNRGKELLGELSTARRRPIQPPRPH